MPRVFHGAEGQTAGEAWDLAAYLATLGGISNLKGQISKVEDFGEAMVKEGGQLFAGLGCVGCHTKPDVEEIDKERGRVPLKYVNAKFQAGALKGWLMNPREHYAWARMPDFRLTEFEADRLVAYLTGAAKGEVVREVKGDAGRGKALFASAGCVNCHRMKDVEGPAATSMAELVAKSDWAKGCMGKDEGTRAGGLEFGLSDAQREAIRAAAATGVEGMTRDVGPEFAERAVRRFQCVACHGRDEAEDRWSTLADEVSEMAPEETNIESDETAGDGGKGARLFVQRGLGKLHGGDRLLVAGDQSRPGLTWAGEKLRPEWMGRFIAGEIGYKPRYWLRARMPAFHGVVAKGIAEGLVLEHGMPTTSVKPGKSDAALAEVGRKLVGRDGGLACVTCHSVVETRAASPFEAPAPNLMHVSERLTHDYYVRWMRKPMRFWPGTKMPQFSEEGRSALKEILGGEADRQFEAIWQYVLRGEGMGAPE
jgi:cytochrome c551/c552